ncbi:hypothetical protein VNO77_22797 [Canavalia gladiata]|uniref:Uncharacterized protein n=1 Tax=Canavalia gladiata TaxID=3824 RepID=A0AAN9L397_CANGL
MPKMIDLKNSTLNLLSIVDSTSSDPLSIDIDPFSPSPKGHSIKTRHGFVFVAVLGDQDKPTLTRVAVIDSDYPILFVDDLADKWPRQRHSRILPITVKADFVGTITLKIEEVELAILDAISRCKLRNASSRNSWLNSLTFTIIGNLKISINNMHIRYEDSFSNSGHPFSSGVTLAKLAAATMDEKGNETFDTSGALDRLKKSSTQLERLALYHNSNKCVLRLSHQYSPTIKALGVDIVPILVGHVSCSLLSKPVEGVDKSFFLLYLLPKVLAIYKEVMVDLKAAELELSLSDLSVFIKTYFSHVPAEACKTIITLKDVVVFGFELAHGTETLELIKKVATALKGSDRHHCCSPLNTCPPSNLILYITYIHTTKTQLRCIRLIGKDLDIESHEYPNFAAL